MGRASGAGLTNNWQPSDPPAVARERLSSIERPQGASPFQGVKCLICGTTTKIYLGPNEGQYQENADVPDDLEKDS